MSAATEVENMATVVRALVSDRADLTILVAYMAESGEYTTQDLAYAVEKPWKYKDELAHAHAALEADES